MVYIGVTAHVSLKVWNGLFLERNSQYRLLPIRVLCLVYKVKFWC